MSSSRDLRIPTGVWGWRATALAMMVVALPALATIQLKAEAPQLGEQAVINALVFSPVTLVAALLFYVHGRLTDDPGMSWLSALLLAGSAKWLSAAIVSSAYPEVATAQAARFLVVDLVLVLLILVALRLVADRPTPFDPAALGFLIGLGLAGLRLVLASSPVPHPLGSTPLAAGTILLIGLNLAVIHALVVHTRLPLWARARLAIALGLMSTASALSDPTIVSALPGMEVLVLVTTYLGGVMLAGVALALARLAVRDNRLAMQALQGRAVRAEAETRDEHERLHEINATVAGIANASRLIQERADLPRRKKGMLQEMMRSEFARLERLMRDRDLEQRDFDLDAVIRPLVVAQQALGQRVMWTPSGVRGHGRPDDVAEVLSILLKNAERHAPQSPVRVDVRRLGDRIEIHVTDDGRGVSEELAAEIFEWGVRGPRSPGEGIGLHLARRLMEDQGGSLQLATTTATRGARFVAGLPGLGQGHGDVLHRSE